MHRLHTVYKQQQSKIVIHLFLVDFDVRGQWEIYFFLEDTILCFMDYGILVRCDGLKLNPLNDGLVLKVMLWSLVDYLWIMFLSAVWILILTAPIHCRGSIGEQVM